MKSNENKFQKCFGTLLRQGHAVWMLLGKCFRRQPRRDDVLPDAVPQEPPTPRLSPLDRISEHLRGLGLGQQVSVRFEPASEDFVLEDADGYVHAKDYDEAVVVIKRIWLYRS